MRDAVSLSESVVENGEGDSDVRVAVEDSLFEFPNPPEAPAPDLQLFNHFVGAQPCSEVCPSPSLVGLSNVTSSCYNSTLVMGESSVGPHLYPTLPPG